MVLAVADDITAAWAEVRASKARYLVVELDGNDAKLSAKGGLDADFEAFKADLPEDQPRYGVYNLMWTADDDRPMSKIIFVNYVPDGCKNMGAKFSYAQQKSKVEPVFQPINKQIQINDRIDLNEEEWKKMF